MKKLKAAEKLQRIRGVLVQTLGQTFLVIHSLSDLKVGHISERSYPYAIKTYLHSISYNPAVNVSYGNI